MALKSINVTPSPRILRMLGHLELKGWQCVAELVDNSIDAALKTPQKLNQISVSIPTKAELSRNIPLQIIDNGVGMTAEELENSLRAGYTSSNTDDLGMFGMGFNIATARLGDVVIVWTSKADMDKDIGVRIDLIEMQKSKSFDLILLERPKSFSPSGTSVEVSKYHPRATQLLNRSHIQKELNRVYSKSLLSENNIKIEINEIELKPFEFCVWDPKRFVEYEGEKIHAVQPFEQSVGSRSYCTRCFIWNDDGSSDISAPVVCSNCNESDKIVKRPITVKGWVGIQRYNDQEHFGINIIRNGRIIKKLDKSLFIWQDRYERNNGQPIKDYPIDTTAQGGRIVGEIFVDFITPTYTKDSFEETDKYWLDAVEVVRGKSPLQPKKATEMNFGKNSSPLAKLFYGYRKSWPAGVRHLIPGNNRKQGLYQLARDWAALFYEGNPEYQDDTKWYEAVLEAEKDGEEDLSGVDPTDPSSSNTTEENSNPIGDVKTTSSVTTVPATGDQELFPGRKTYKYQQVFDLRPAINELPYIIDIYDYWPSGKFDAPLIFDATQASKFNVYINNHHPLFKDFADGWDDLMYMEIATRYYEKLNNIDEWPVSRLYYELKLKFAKSKMLDTQALISESKALMTEIQNYIANEYSETELSPNPELSFEEQKYLRSSYLQVEGEPLNNVNSLVKTTAFIKYMDLNYIFKFINQYPSLVYDDTFFNLPYMNIEDEDVRELQFERYNSYMNDVRWFIYELSNYPDALVKQQKNLIVRNRFSLDYLSMKKV